MNLTDFLGDISSSAGGFDVERILGPGGRVGEGPQGGGGRILCRMLVVSGESERRRPPIAGSGVVGVPIARDARRLGVLPSVRETEDIRWAAIAAGWSSRFEDDVNSCVWVGWFSFSGERLLRGRGDVAGESGVEGFGLEEKEKGRGDEDLRPGFRGR